MAESVAARSIRLVETGVACDHGISTSICEEVDRVARGRAALCGDLTELSAENRPKKAFNASYMIVRKL